MSNAAGPQCSSGVESGWTLYLDNDDDEYGSSISTELHRKNPGNYRSGWGRKGEDDESEDLSMVSDASSGPPYFKVEDWSCHLSGGGGSLTGSEKNGEKKDKRQKSSGRRHSHYEDTACSHQKNFSLPDNDDAPWRHASDNFFQGHSIEESGYGNHYRCLQSPVADQSAASKKASHSRKLM